MASVWKIEKSSKKPANSFSMSIYKIFKKTGNWLQYVNLQNLRKKRQMASVCENERVLVFWDCCQLGVFADWGCSLCASPRGGLQPPLGSAGWI